MLFSTFLTLVLVPVVYTLLARFTGREQVAATEAVEAGVPEAVGDAKIAGSHGA